MGYIRHCAFKYQWSVFNAWRVLIWQVLVWHVPGPGPQVLLIDTFWVPLKKPKNRYQKMSVLISYTFSKVDCMWQLFAQINTETVLYKYSQILQNADVYVQRILHRAPVWALVYELGQLSLIFVRNLWFFEFHLLRDNVGLKSRRVNVKQFSDSKRLAKR